MTTAFELDRCRLLLRGGALAKLFLKLYGVCIALPGTLTTRPDPKIETSALNNQHRLFVIVQRQHEHKWAYSKEEAATAAHCTNTYPLSSLSSQFIQKIDQRLHFLLQSA